jgi:hypothetical protein
MKKIVLLFTILFINNLAFSLPENITPDTVSFLTKPTGQYGVGFKNIHFVDQSRCPDEFYHPDTASDYSPGNKNHCREIMVRVYYPTNQPVSLGNPYYGPEIAMTKDLFNEIAGMIRPGTQIDYSQLDSLRTYSHQNDPVAVTQTPFPVIIFAHGATNPVEDYEDIITNLVSNGYVVVGVNSLFLSGYTALPNGHVIKKSFANTYKHLAVQKIDIMYVYQHLADINQSLSNSMDLQEVGLMGHSAGANATASLVSSANKHYFQAAVAMDADVKPNFQGFSIPFLHELSGSRYWVVKYGPPSVRVSYMPTYTLNKNNYLLGVVPNESGLLYPPQDGPLYSIHGSFTDWATLQYTSAYQEMVPIFDEFNPTIFGGNSPGYEWGVGDGMEIMNTINTYTLQFFDTYLKHEPNAVFNTGTCSTLTPNSILSCGPTVFPGRGA